MVRAVKKGYEIIGSLIRSSLLMEYGPHHVYMHDVVREMALWIASDFRKKKDYFIVQSGIGLNKIPKVQNWNIVRRMSLMSNKFDRISGSLDCLELKTLFLHQNQTLASISGSFFMNMPRLVVLNLSGNRNLYELPDEISQLVSLKYLDMSNSGLQCLPVGFLKLKVLTHLNLDATENLSSIVGISALLNLKVVKLWKSKVSYDLNTVKELLGLEHLEALTLSISYDSGLDQLLCSHNLIRCTKVLQINCLELDSLEVSLLASMETLSLVTLNECTFYEKKMDSAISKMVPPLHNPIRACFLTLSNIYILRSKGLKDLTWLMFAPNLRVLYVEGGDELEDLIQEEKTIACEGSGFVPFRRLESLQLINLRELKNIYWRPLRFPFLREICIEECPKLRKLPLNSESCPSGEKGMAIKYKGREWLEGIEWEDEATKARFLPSCIEV
ncbi:putative disease resistance protein [Raphanus sativus]|nr:putative disease resistance protein [Raphanus sativus]